MNLSLIRSMTRSAVFELENDLCYRPAHPFIVTLNGRTVYEACNTNVFSLFSLLPGTEYTVGVQAEGESLTKVLVVPMSSEVMPSAVAAAGAFRAAGINTDVYYGDKGMKPKMKFANRSGIPYVALVGEDEAAAGKLTLKNMETGEQALLDVYTAIEQIKPA